MEEIDLQQHDIYLHKWNVSLTVVLTPEGPYFLIRQLCAVLGLSSIQAQTNRIREHAVLAKFVKQWPIKTIGGKQQSWCLHRRGVGFWLGTLQDNRVRPEIRPQLIALQEEILEAADRLLFGEVASAPSGNNLTRIDGQMADLRHFTLSLENRIGQIEAQVFLPENDELD